MMSRRAFGLLICFWSAECVSAAQSSPPECGAPVWKQEVLADFSSNQAGVAFLDDQRLIVYHLEPSGQLSSRTSHEISSAFRLRVRILEVRSGMVRLTKDFNARPHGSAVQVTTGGILINTGEIVR